MNGLKIQWAILQNIDVNGTYWNFGVSFETTNYVTAFTRHGSDVDYYYPSVSTKERTRLWLNPSHTLGAADCFAIGF